MHKCIVQVMRWRDTRAHTAAINEIDAHTMYNQRETAHHHTPIDTHVFTNKL